MSTSDSNHPLRSWDRLSDIDVENIESETTDPSVISPALADTVPRSARLGAAWADLVVVGALTTSMIGAVIVSGYPLSIRALPWAVIVALIGWGAACGVVLRVRRGTLGMMMAGFVFTEEVAGRRLGWTVAAAAFSALLLGLPVLPGGSATSLLSVASGSSIAPNP
ncbi:MAG: hypothetical protein DRJ61_01795 [Acidobacteria bacterium]|nr:MAG: hypothetical protein DRJ61_01795 [Acidobacteriota bacterium]